MKKKLAKDIRDRREMKIEEWIVFSAPPGYSGACTRKYEYRKKPVSNPALM